MVKGSIKSPQGQSHQAQGTLDHTNLYVLTSDRTHNFQDSHLIYVTTIQLEQ